MEIKTMSAPATSQIPLKPAPYTDRYVEVAGLKLHLLDYGTAGKPQMLCMHGSAAHAHWFDFVAPGFTNDYHVLAPDQRGHGDSEWDRSPEPEYNYDRYAADLHELTEKLDLRDFILVGHSMGGLVSIVYAATYPGRAKAFIMIDSSVNMPPERVAVMNEIGSREGSSYADQNEFVAKFKVRPAGSSATPEIVRHLALHSGRQFDDGRWRSKVDRNVYARRVSRALMPYWANIKIPALLMKGDRSNRVSPEIITGVKALAPQVQVAEVAGCDHHVTLDNPPGFVEVAKKWLINI
jgi:pimeloyl-ACP methyl ester carboxylesterase